MSNIISFISNRPWLSKESFSVPGTIMKTIPDWYRKADRFAKRPDGEFWIGPDKGKIPTWKACPSLFDIMGSGYTLKTPCDIEFYLNSKGKISVKIEDIKYKDFCTKREKMPQFENPHGYYEEHFAWLPDWAVVVPEGYSVLYTQPFNRFELPFLSVSGIVDNDHVITLGTMPFFIKEGFIGLLPAGTPYMQMLPFKREDWASEVIIEDQKEMYAKNVKVSAKYRIPNGGVYKNEVWKPRRYE